MLMPNAGRAGSEWMAGQLAERGISKRVGAKAERVEAGRVVLADGGEEPFDLLVAVPPHRPPAVVAESGLVAGHGWIGVDPGTLATAHEGVYAVGDVNLIPLANGLPLPKAGVMAELQGLRVARAIAAELRGERAAGAVRRQRLLPGRGRRGRRRRSCRATGTPSPSRSCAIEGPSAAYAAEKRAFETRAPAALVRRLSRRRRAQPASRDEVDAATRPARP